VQRAIVDKFTIDRHRAGYTVCMPQFNTAVIIFNPNSTGDAKTNATALQASLKRSLPSLTVKLLPTDHAGHAIDLAYDAAKEYGNPLIISASGDGGYNEVINGALRAQEEGAKPICAVLPSGNANDHARTMQNEPLADLIVKDQVKQHDVLRLSTIGQDGAKEIRYAHSYIGLGITPAVAVELNKHTLNSFRESWIVMRTFWKLRPVIIRKDDKRFELDSLICSIIPEMAKVLTLSSDAKPDDGKFELATLQHNKKLHLIGRLLKGVVSDMGATSRIGDYSCTVLQAVPIQLDGEVMKLKKQTQLKISICPRLLRTVV
jgi:diacylglycerol kinase (ATP)